MSINKNIAISDSGFVFNPSSGESFTVNQTGTELLNMIKEGKSDVEIREAFLEKYDTNANTFDKDFQDFKEMMASYQLMEQDKA